MKLRHMLLVFVTCAFATSNRIYADPRIYASDSKNLRMIKCAIKSVPLTQDLLIQAIYSPDLKLSFTVQSISTTKIGKKPGSWVFIFDAGQSSSQDSWRIQGEVPKSKDSKGGSSLQHATVLAFQQLEKEGLFELPAVLSIHSDQKKWYFLLKRLPFLTGGDTAVVVSKGDNKVEIIRGH